MIPARAAAMTAMPTVPKSHLRFLSCALIYGFRSSVPGIVHAFVCQTHQPSMNRRSARFRTDSMTSSCQKPVRKSLAPLTA